MRATVSACYCNARHSEHIRHIGGAMLDQAFVRSVRTYTAMLD